MANRRRIAITFDERGLMMLKAVVSEGYFLSMAVAVRTSLQIMSVLIDQAKQGFTEVIVRNPKAGQGRVIIIPAIDYVMEMRRKSDDEIPS